MWDFRFRLLHRSVVLRRTVTGYPIGISMPMVYTMIKMSLISNSVALISHQHKG